MSKYRIIQYTNPFCTFYKVQKQIFSIFWYNFNNIDAYTTGYYSTKNEAVEAIKKHQVKTTKKVLGEYR